MGSSFCRGEGGALYQGIPLPEIFLTSYDVNFTQSVLDHIISLICSFGEQGHMFYTNFFSSLSTAPPPNTHKPERHLEWCLGSLPLASGWVIIHNQKHMRVSCKAVSFLFSHPHIPTIQSHIFCWKLKATDINYGLQLLGLMYQILYFICHRILRPAFLPFFRKLTFSFPLVELYMKKANLLGQWQFTWMFRHMVHKLLHSVLNRFLLMGSILSAIYATGGVMKMLMWLPVNILRPQAPNSRMSVLQLFLQQEEEIK